MEREIICPRCGKETFYVYRFLDSDAFAGCEHCAPKLDSAVGYYDMRDFPEDYKPLKTVCPVCGDICHTIYRQGRHSEIVGCDKCVYAVNAALDAEEQPGDYGLPDPDEEE